MIGAFGRTADHWFSGFLPGKVMLENPAMKSSTRFISRRCAAALLGIVCLLSIGFHRSALSLMRGTRHELLWRMCSFGNGPGVQVLLFLGADPDGERDSRDHSSWYYPSRAGLPAGEALRSRHSHVLLILLENGANPDAEPSPPDDENLLSLAVGLEDEACVAMLLKAGARRITPSGKNILELARRGGGSNAVLRLLEKPE